ncbi:MAG: hypothetical protein ACRYFZ_26805 [Janthinobacterium lividum]
MLRSFLCLLSGCLLLACSPQQATDTATSPAAAPATSAAATAVPASGAAVSWPAPFSPVASQQCVRVATRPASIYHLPVVATPQFGQLAKGEKVTLAARTATGWVGFDPGTAQAANVGVFRLRWVRTADAFGADSAGCAQLPVVSAPPAGCLLMAAHPVAVRARPAASAALLGTIPTGSYAQVGPQTNAVKGWTIIELPGQATPGYVAEADVNLTGPCR